MKRIAYILTFAVLAACSGIEVQGELTWTDTDSYPVWKGERRCYMAEFSADRDLDGLRLKVSDLKGPSGRINSSSIQAGFMSYVMADVLDTTKFNQCGYRPKGKYDSLYVAEIIDIVETKNVKAGEIQPVWVKVSVPEDAEPGLYKGRVVLAEKGKRWSLPIELEVIDRVLPEPSDWKFHLDLWQNPYAVARYHGVEPWSDAHFEAMFPVMKMLADAGQKVVTATILDRPWDGQTEDAYGSMVRKVKFADGRWEYDFSVFDKWVEFMFSLGINRHINCYSMIPWKLTFDYIDGDTGKTEYITAAPGSVEYTSYWDNFIRAFAKHLKQKGWFDKTMIAMDERAMRDMLMAIEVIKNAEPEFKVSLAGNYHPELETMLDDYCLAIQQDFPEDVLASRKARGAVSTIYTCCSEGKPNLFVASDPVEAVWLGIYAAARGYDGYLRWAYNSWTADPLKDARFRTWPAGDCFVVYPEGRSSVHFEKLIEGIQDYEKIRILKERWSAEGDHDSILRLDEALEEISLTTLFKDGPDKGVREIKGLIN